jgi:glycosyltransferase involved in cell wall biosynthesis
MISQIAVEDLLNRTTIRASQVLESQHAHAITIPGCHLKRVLMIAFHFPPLSGSSGIQRTLRFVQHLPSLGWQPIVLGASPVAFENTSQDLMAEVPLDTVVRRAFALDAARHLQLGGRYLGWTARPDRWMSWKFAGIHEGLRLIRQHKPDVIWSTYPIATAHVIGSALHRKTGIPWVADFRDPMAQEDYPPDPKTKRSFLAIEADATRHATYCVFTTPGAADDYRQRYPYAARRIVVVENGYDEESFASTQMATRGTEDLNGGPLLLLHSGIVYPSERDPTQLFDALGRLKSAGLLGPADLRVRFRASFHDALLTNLAAAAGALEFIEICPPIPYREALQEMMSADALLVMQASNCNAQIPAKVYEYLRAGRPILGLTDPKGDTAGVLRQAGVVDIVRLDSSDEIAATLERLIREWRNGKGVLPAEEAVHRASRRCRSEALAGLFSEIGVAGTND